MFTYFLVKGLYGMADANHNGRVTLMELRHYLEEQVSSQAQPHKQVPVTQGEMTAQVARVDQDLLATIESDPSNRLPIFTAGNSKSLDDMNPDSIDPALGKQYRAFQRALAEKRFFIPDGNNAEAMYNFLMGQKMLAPLYPHLTRQYAAALQNGAQEAINAILSGNLLEINKSVREQLDEYGNFPQYLARAAELLGSEHYMYPSLKARQHLFEGWLLYLKTVNSGGSVAGMAVMAYYREALEFEPHNTLTHLFMGECFARQLHQIDSADFHGRQAIRYADTWPLPYAMLALRLSQAGRFEPAKEILDRAMALDSTDAFVLMSLGAWYNYLKQYAAAAKVFEKVTVQEPENDLAWYNLGAAQYNAGDYHGAENAALESAQLNPDQFNAFDLLGLVYANWEQYETAASMYEKALAANPLHASLRVRLGFVYVAMEKYEQAEAEFHEAVRLNPEEKDPDVWYNLFYFAVYDGRLEEALGYLKRTLELGGITRQELEEDSDLKALRKTKGYKELVGG
ncbi:MAG: tetratricopeptide repeat protein [Lewinellaceae bacterium]|nr:tetratricopeptide repeat protein [Lewinellaceae bacterium]